MKKECENCRTEFNSYDSRSKFCNKSCAASFNNKKRKKKHILKCQNCSIETSGYGKKYCSIKCQAEFNRKTKLESGNYSAPFAKKYLMSKNNSCYICGLDPKWNDKDLIMVLDHIDGNAGNNDMNNLRLVCPNCDSQLDTFKSRNRGNGRHSRKIRYQNGQSY